MSLPFIVLSGWDLRELLPKEHSAKCAEYFPQSLLLGYSQLAFPHKPLV